MLRERPEESSISITSWIETNGYGLLDIEAANSFFEIIACIRNFRNSKHISPKVALKLQIKETSVEANFLSQFLNDYIDVIKKLSNVSEIILDKSNTEGIVIYVTKKYEFSIISENLIDLNFEEDRLKKDLEYQKGFLQSVEKKLSNERFVQNAKPEVIAIEQKKKADAEAKIKVLEESLANL